MAGFGRLCQKIKSLKKEGENVKLEKKGYKPQAEPLDDANIDVSETPKHLVSNSAFRVNSGTGEVLFMDPGARETFQVGSGTLGETFQVGSGTLTIGPSTQTPTPTTPVLPQSKSIDDGVVTLSDVMGDDLSVVNAARVSFGKRKTKIDESDIKLIKFLAKHKHMSPFRHVVFSFTLENVSEVLCRQLYKHQVGCAFTSGEFREAATTWNEISGRYVNFDANFYVPEKFRPQSKSNKQASIQTETVKKNDKAKKIYEKSIKKSYQAYQELLDLGVCKEQARMVMPISFQNSLVWTASLEAVVNFIKLRDHDGAQLEIRQMAQAVHELVSLYCPESVTALLLDSEGV